MLPTLYMINIPDYLQNIETFEPFARNQYHNLLNLDNWRNSEIELYPFLQWILRLANMDFDPS